MANTTPAPGTPAPGTPAPMGGTAPAGPGPGPGPGAPFGDRPRMSPPPIRRTDSSRCRTPGCLKYHDFFQWNGKYYCLECYEALRSATRAGATTASLAPGR
jgi:hypothetical protein